MATRIKSTQPRVAKIEAASADVSLDQMFRGLFAVGGSVDDLSVLSPKGRNEPQPRVSEKTVASPTSSQSPSAPAEPQVPRRKGKKPGTPVGA